MEICNTVCYNEVKSNLIVRKENAMDIYKKLTDAFDYYNKTLFESLLPTPIITIAAKRNAHGYFAPDKFKLKSDKEQTNHEIALNPETFDREDKEIMSTLAHEMTHLWQEVYGNPGKGKYTIIERKRTLCLREIR